jgi:hypothetical protein
MNWRCVTLSLQVAAALAIASACTSSSEPSQKRNKSAASDTTAARSGTRSGSPFDFATPVQLVNAAAFTDGGTIGVQLKDANGKVMAFCVSEGAFAETIPAGTLFLEGVHPSAPSARLPVSEEEARAVIAALEDALRHSLPDRSKQLLDKQEVSLAQLYEDAYQPGKLLPHDKEDWLLTVAFDSWIRIANRTRFDTYAPEKSSQPKWYVAYDKAKREELAEAENQKRADQRFEACYPEAARAWLTLSQRTGDVQVLPGGQGYGSPDPLIAEQGRKLAAAVGNPVNLAVISCRALGGLQQSWSYSTSRDLIAIEAARTLSPAEFTAALHRIRDDDQAMLGAALLFFYLRLGEQMSDSEWQEWASPITKAVLQHGPDDNKPLAIQSLARVDRPGAVDLLRVVASGTLGVESQPVAERKWGEEPSLKELAYLALAQKGDQLVRENIVQALADAKGRHNIAALRVSLALLGEPEYLSNDIFAPRSHTIGLAAVRAIEQFEGAHGMDVLMTAGLDHDYAAVKNEAMLAAQRLTGQEWVPPTSRVQPRSYADQARDWWKIHREEFLRKHQGDTRDE